MDLYLPVRAMPNIRATSTVEDLKVLCSLSDMGPISCIVGMASKHKYNIRPKCLTNGVPSAQNDDPPTDAASPSVQSIVSCTRNLERAQTYQ